MAIRFIGKVERIFAGNDGVYLRVNHTLELKPKDDYCLLNLEHPNFNALYSLALAAAANRWPLHIRVGGETIDPNEFAVVTYFVVDWSA